jgi:hypothetical protein
MTDSFGSSARLTLMLAQLQRPSTIMIVSVDASIYNLSKGCFVGNGRSTAPEDDCQVRNKARYNNSTEDKIGVTRAGWSSLLPRQLTTRMLVDSETEYSPSSWYHKGLVILVPSVSNLGARTHKYCRS